MPDRFAQYAPVIQQAATAVQNAFLVATGGAQSVRFDAGTNCGANYLDIQSVVLPRTAAQYSASNATTTMSSDLRPLVGGSPSCPTVSASQCTRDFLVFADGVAKSDPADPDYGVTGVATRRMDNLETSPRQAAVDQPGEGLVVIDIQQCRRRFVHMAAGGTWMTEKNRPSWRMALAKLS